MEELLAKHRKEQRDLQATITQKKKQATKKTRKGVNDECITLEQELKERQGRELVSLNGVSDADGVHKEANGAPTPPSEDRNDTGTAKNGLPQNIENLSVADTDETIDNHSPGPSRKPNRQKARLARRAAEQEAIAAKATEEAANMPDQRQIERTRMIEELQKRGLREREIRPDGHCLYSAVADQLGQTGLSLEPRKQTGGSDGQRAAGLDLPDYKQIRLAAASYILDHPDDFAPFLEEPFQEYVHKVRDTAEWGGHLELLALARTYGVGINVLQGNGRVEKIEADSDGTDKEIWLAYYRHGFGLGEHYNSLRKAP